MSTLVLSPERYMLTPMQIENLASEFYGKCLDDDATLTTMSLEFDDPSMEGAFVVTLNAGFKVAKKRGKKADDEAST